MRHRPPVRPPDLDAAFRPLPPRPPPTTVPLPPLRERVAEGVRLVGSAVLIAFLIKTFVVQAFFIPSRSMQPTLEVGDRIVVEKLSYLVGGDPLRGDVIVFRDPDRLARPALERVGRALRESFGFPATDESDVVKRVVGLPGEVVEVRAGRVLIDGVVLREGYELPDLASAPPVRVPPAAYYVLGDNRASSEDSRVIGPVPRGDVVGRALAVVWPLRHVDVRLDAAYAEPAAAGADG